MRAPGQIKVSRTQHLKIFRVHRVQVFSVLSDPSSAPGTLEGAEDSAGATVALSHTGRWGELPSPRSAGPVGLSDVIFVHVHLDINQAP